MTTDSEQPPLRRRLEIGRLVLGSLLEMGIKAYGAGAAVSVAMSDAETVSGKAHDAIAAVPNLSDQYRDAKYIIDHREEIQAAVSYLNEHTLPQEELEDAAARSSETLRGIETTSDELSQIGDALTQFPPRPDEALGHVGAAWEALPDRESISYLAQVAEQLSPFVDEVEVLIPVYYGGLLAVTDNFASDEIVATISVMAVAFTIAVVLGQAVGFWVRRGRPGLIARTLQRWGARTFRPWYVHNLPYALSPPLYDVARERIQREIVADPESTLGPEDLQELELYFAGRAGNGEAGGEPSVRP